MFEVHLLNDQGKKKATQLQVLFGDFLKNVEEVIGPIGQGGREMAIVRTNLETASFYAKRAMAMKSENHDEVIG